MVKDKSAKKSSGVKKQPHSTTTTTTTSSAVQIPKWPPFRPALPVTSLSLTAPVPSLEDRILVIRNFFPKSLCRDYVAFLRTLPLVTTPGRPRRGEAVRVNDRYQVNDFHFSQRLWLETGLKDTILDQEFQNLWGGGAVVGLNPNIRVYRYSKGQYFDTHCE